MAVQRGPSPEEETPSAEELPQLPGDVLSLAFEHLEVADLAAAGSVSREWRGVAAAAEGAWQRQALAEFREADVARHAHLRRWRDRYIACKLEAVGQRLRDKGRYLDEMEDSATAVERQAQQALKRLNQLDRTLGQRRAELSGQLAELSGHPGTHAGSRRGKELLAQAQAGTLAAGQEAGAALAAAAADVDKWRQEIAQEKGSLHRHWDSLSYIQTCVKKARADIAALQRRRTRLEEAKLWRPTLRRS